MACTRSRYSARERTRNFDGDSVCPACGGDGVKAAQTKRAIMHSRDLVFFMFCSSTFDKLRTFLRLAPRIPFSPPRLVRFTKTDAREAVSACRPHAAVYQKDELTSKAETQTTGRNHPLISVHSMDWNPANSKLSWVAGVISPAQKSPVVPLELDAAAENVQPPGRKAWRVAPRTK